MGAIQNLLEACLKQGIVLSDNLKRAIFWQDLNSSVMTGSSRTFHHQSFPELSWSRDKTSSTFFKLPPGFQVLSSVLGHTFLEIMEDVHALQQIRDTNLFGPEDAIHGSHLVDIRLLLCRGLSMLNDAAVQKVACLGRAGKHIWTIFIFFTHLDD
ncbi:hypothetical protein D7B24_006173 [Verticillium nonalfalfae]|uniref:Uncharacterized protein n=1 Tax=Verticillium nonalfalfae TaxID=1051616 RepID=A0A3M9YE75_9PEZI|nr:uncharacterized protein D7B24_006173 [Verticillium nonalfalfae]RNJ57410.1 hypothetical protein D7B24_006173 [Verticillium nonalfalfae]